MIEDLIATIESYKAFMEYKNLDFDADKHVQYIWVREAMAKRYKEIDETLFGPVNLPTLQQNTNQLTKEEQKDVRKKFKKQTKSFKKGKNRVIEKAKEICQLFSKAVVSGS